MKAPPTLIKKRLTICLLDLIGSTAFVQKVGPMKAASWLQYHDRLTRTLMLKFNGREIDRSDGFLISFNRPIDAVDFALHYQIHIPPKTRLQTRIGVHVGDVVEVRQHELDILTGAKPIEIEGVAKNIAARTMSLCGPGQVLLTQDAFRAIKHQNSPETPRKTRYAVAGLYKFKGVKKPISVYCVGITTESLQPPPGSEKARRLGGPKRIKSHVRHMRARELLLWLLYRLAVISSLYIMYLFLRCIARPEARRFWGIDYPPYSYMDAVGRFLKAFGG